MSTPITLYIQNLNTRYKAGISTEHSYRPDLQRLLEALIPTAEITNEPTRVACGAPDYIITKKGIPTGYIEAKDLGADLKSKVYLEQFTRYRKGISSLIITDYLTFEFYKQGELITIVSIGKISRKEVKSIPENYNEFTKLIGDFSQISGQTIRSAKKLAEMMAGKAKLMAIVIENAIKSDESLSSESVFDSANNTIRDQMEAFKEFLIHDLTPKGFADIYSQTIAYGMFAARAHDNSLETFSRQEAAHLIPKSNPFLRNLFQYNAGYELDIRIKWIVDDLADIFRATDLRTILKDFWQATHMSDPIIHFYETFLAEYDPNLRKIMGVWYTPAPVVKYIVQAVDEVLKTSFSLNDGIADTSKTRITVKVPTSDKRFLAGMRDYNHEIHKVQILDPATGTGTFLAEIVKYIYEKQFSTIKGIWSTYVEDDLIPRLNGFEILMASYAMAHLKIDMLLKETGYNPSKDQRLRIYLTNSLEEHHKDTGNIFASWLSNEANEANRVKRDTPVMVIMGNPPYSGISLNIGTWITNLIDQYKYINGEHFKERKHWLQDDYVKFIRYGQYFIEKNGEGILAYINNHGFLDNPTFRGMRWNLLQAFDEIYILDLHGNTMKKEVNPTSVPDKNVFDIQQGVSINIFIKKKNHTNSNEAVIYHKDLWGSREDKFNFLLNNTISSTGFTQIQPTAPYYFFTNVQYEGGEQYNLGFGLNELFKEIVTGIVTARDALVIDINQQDLLDRIAQFSDASNSDDQIRAKYFGHKKVKNYLAGDSRGWKLSKARVSIRANKHIDFIKKIDYRPFDQRYIY